MTCGPACLRIVAAYHGRNYPLAKLVELSGANREGTTFTGLSEAAEKIGLRTLGVKVELSRLQKDIPMPCIAHWNQNHFVVIYKVTRSRVYVSDPAHGLIEYTHDEFARGWVSDGKDIGILLLVETTPFFYKEKSEDGRKKKTAPFLFSYLSRHKKAVIQLMIGLVAGSLLQLVFPFLTQSILDIGVQNRDIHFVYLILFAQLMVFFGRTTMDIIRSYILMHISSRINISLISDFFVKLMKLPIAYFDSKLTGDILQRISDNHRIESFLTGASLSTIFSLFNFVIFSGVLAWYSPIVFAVFVTGSVFYFLWIMFFLRRRADIDFKRFQQSSQNQGKVMELINGMQEIKLHNAERQKRWQWENLQVKLFRINLKGLALSVVQNSGSALINELKNIIITFLAAKLVIDGQISLGMMLSISYIIGQLNSPILELVNFIQSWQDARLSLERLNEIHEKEDEEANTDHGVVIPDAAMSFHLRGVSFRYEGAGNSDVLKNINAVLPARKLTAIVGASGCGKTTLLKLLLRFYTPSEGTITLDDLDLNTVSASQWRGRCGVVMQEGYIFNDTIAGNIAVGEDEIDMEKLIHAVTVANIREFIESMPMGYNTKIGMEGVGISTGQKQRILIARAVYKNPDFLFFDEATSALDANNEKTIMERLNVFFKNKTVVVIAHRLSTVKNADQILVLDGGEIIEQGNHAELTARRGAYYELVKNQLELGN